MHNDSFDDFEVRVAQAIKQASPGGARWFDQKVTFDNFFVVAKAVNLSIQTDELWFDRFDIQSSPYLAQELKREYGKPDIDDIFAANEYDKFISQNLNVLANGGVLYSKRKGSRVYQVSDREMLREICQSERNARTFLIAYLEAILKGFNWWYAFEAYAERQTSEAFADLKASFEDLLVQTMGLGTRQTSNPSVESGRIFAKVLNLLAFQYGVKGAEKGRMMSSIPTRLDLSYNRTNFRDQASGKDKGQTRKVYEKSLEVSYALKPQTNLTKIMRDVQKYHHRQSEVPTNSISTACHVHHIFPRSKYPEYADLKENMICLTPGQHYGEAHPKGNTREVDVMYQKTCLFHKLDSVRKSIENGDGFYSYQRFGALLADIIPLDAAPGDYDSCREAIFRFG